MLTKTLKEKKELVNFIKKMKKTFDAFKNTHAEIIERGKPSSETTKANTAMPPSASKPPTREGSMSARSNRSSSQRLTNSQLLKRRSTNRRETSNPEQEIQADTGSERSHYSNDFENTNWYIDIRESRTEYIFQ